MSYWYYNIYCVAPPAVGLQWETRQISGEQVLGPGKHDQDEPWYSEGRIVVSIVTLGDFSSVNTKPIYGCRPVVQERGSADSSFYTSVRLSTCSPSAGSRRTLQHHFQGTPLRYITMIRIGNVL
jgi:hypothetical protein